MRARNYPDLPKTGKGLVRRFVAKVTGLSRAQTARLIGKYVGDGCVRFSRGRGNFEKTRPTPVSIGERQRPRPEGRAGYLRLDTVHQGDLDGVKGVYYINAVDEVTQWEVVSAVAHISEAWLRPLLEQC